MSVLRKLDFPLESDSASRDKKPTRIQPDRLAKRKPVNPKIDISQPSTSKTLTEAEKRKRGWDK